MKRCKRLAALLLALGLLVGLSACGNVRGLKMEILDVGTHVEPSVKAAMRLVTWEFCLNWDDCTLTRLWYDGAKTAEEEPAWAAQYDADEAIVLYADFDVGPSGGDGSLNPNSTYADWAWVLTRTDGGAWKLQTWGY